MPLKFKIFASTKKQTSVPAVAGFQVLQVKCTSGFEDPISTFELVTTGGTSLRYDSQFIVQ